MVAAIECLASPLMLTPQKKLQNQSIYGNICCKIKLEFSAKEITMTDQMCTNFLTTYLTEALNGLASSAAESHHLSFYNQLHLFLPLFGYLLLKDLCFSDYEMKFMLTTEQ